MYTPGPSTPAAMLLYCNLFPPKTTATGYRQDGKLVTNRKTNQPVVIAHSTMPMPEPSKNLYHTGTGRRALYNKVRFSAQVRL